MASSRHVGRVLRRILTLSLAPLAGGCSGPGTESFEAIACGSDQRPRYLLGLQPAAPADYLELRQAPGVAAGGGTTLESVGEKCSHATDQPACEAHVAELSSAQGFQLGHCASNLCPKVFLIRTAGDDVTLIDTVDAMKSFVLPVDTPADAVLIAALAQYSVGCGDLANGGVRATEDGYEVIARRTTSACPTEETRYLLRVDADGTIEELEAEVVSSSTVCIGRRPAGLARSRPRGATRVGAYFAQVAHLEAASVHAFEALREELIHHGAPRSLRDRAGAARLDEVRHARVMRRVAARYGGVAPPPRVDRRPPRSLAEIALDNAAEGCVRETFGALVGMWQARFARDAAVRRVMRRIAEDETRHASLAWSIDAWIRPRLSPVERRRMEDARRSALDEVAEEARRGHDGALVAWAGLPGPSAGRRLSQHFAQAVDSLVRG